MRVLVLGWSVIHVRLRSTSTPCPCHARSLERIRPLAYGVDREHCSLLARYELNALLRKPFTVQPVNSRFSAPWIHVRSEGIVLYSSVEIIQSTASSIEFPPCYKSEEVRNA
ncbi:hypothetical protein TREES_T100021481 [Tupaia chinensis]|uniref:Uncharacterized protein n=1 Tax=Tupaia chinensis TaxID=246437 RepID=L9KI01_TUPCH|nr:hypothetical protein TREES_T100021481 [Tupaia chinensis]